MHKVQVTPLIGLPQFDGWSQVVTNDDTTLTVALAVGGVNAGNVGRDLVINLAQARPQTAAELHTLLLDVLHAATTVGSHVAMGACCCIGEVSMFAAYQGAVLLKRGAKSGIVLSAPDSLKVVEGKHTIDDVVVVATSQATSFFGEIQQKLTQGFDVDTIVTSIVPGLHSTQNSALSCLAFISFDDHEIIEAEKPLLEIEVEALPEALTPLQVEEMMPNPVVSATLPEAPTVASDTHIDTSVKSQPLQLEISSETTDRLNASLRPKLQGGYQILLRLGRGVLRVIKRLPAIARKINHRAQPLYSRGQYVTSMPKQQVIRLFVPIVIGAGILIGGGLFWRQQMAQQVQAAEAVFQPLQERFVLAESLVETQPIEARAEMEKILAEMEATKTAFARQRAALNYLEQELQATQAKYQEVSGRHEVSALNVFFDVQSVKSDFIATKADADATRSALLDNEKKQLVLLDLATKQSQTISLESIGKPTHLSISPTRVLILGSGIRYLDLADVSSGLKNIKEEGDSNRDGVLVGSFGQYVYVVNPSKRNIFRYAPDGDAYTDPIGWLKPGQSVPYDQLTSLAIDGDVWLGTRDSEIIKLTQGGQVTFDVKGLPEGFSGSLYVYTKESMSNLYILEPSNRRLVILKKTGEFVREIKSDSLASASSVFADETLGKAFVVNGSLIFEVSL